MSLAGERPTHRRNGTLTISYDGLSNMVVARAMALVFLFYI